MLFSTRLIPHRGRTPISNLSANSSIMVVIEINIGKFHLPDVTIIFIIFFLTFYFGLFSSRASRNIASPKLHSKIIILYPEAFLLFVAVLVLIASDVFIKVLINIAWLRQTIMAPGRNTVSEGDTRIQNLNLAFSLCLFSSLALCL